MKILSRRGEARVWFAGDQPAAAGGFDRHVAERVAKKFDFLEIGAAVRSDQQQVWMARRGIEQKASAPAPRGGQRSSGETKSIHVLQAQGIESDLSVEVDGTTADAHAALESLWKCLAGEDAAPVESLGTILDTTTMVVELPVAFDHLVPIASLMREFVGSRLYKSGRPMPREPQHRFSVEFVDSIGARLFSRPLTIEPRATTTLNRRIYFTQSPLATEDHEALLDMLVKVTTAK